MKIDKKEVVRYGIAGIINTTVGYGIFIILVYMLSISPYYSNIVGYIFGLFVAFLLNKYFVFNVKKTTIIDIVKFLISFIVAYSINIFVLFLCLNTYTLSPAVGQIFATVFYTVSFYILNKLIVFKPFYKE